VCGDDAAMCSQRHVTYWLERSPGAQYTVGYGKEPKKMMNMGYSLWGVLILIGDVWAIINIFQSSASNEKKLLWIIVVVLLPLLGLILWFFLGPRERKA